MDGSRTGKTANVALEDDHMITLLHEIR